MRVSTRPGVRDAVAAYSATMMEKLAQNDHKQGWDECSLLWLQAKLAEEVGELSQLLVDIHSPVTGFKLHKVAPETIEAIKLECADIGNLAMMIFDVLGKEQA